MGTSTARRGPGTAAWRQAKKAATRYMSAGGAAPAEAREIVQPYIAALVESSALKGQDLLAAFRLTRRNAQSLGEFVELASGAGFAEALGALGFAEFTQLGRTEAIVGLTQTWLEGEDGLEAAVVRSALFLSLEKLLSPRPDAIPHESPYLVKEFLAVCFCQRLIFDLGESLEAAAPGWKAYQHGLDELQDEIMAATGIADGPPRGRQWQGLAGWLWVTRVLENIRQHFRDARP